MNMRNQHVTKVSDDVRRELYGGTYRKAAMKTQGVEERPRKTEIDEEWM